MHGSAAPSRYEHERERQIAKNQLRLQQLGVVAAADELRAEGRPVKQPREGRKPAVVGKAPVLRQSRRLARQADKAAGVLDEDDAEDGHADGDDAAEAFRIPAVRQQRDSSQRCSDVEALRQHNEHRLNTMTDAQLRRRIRAIKRIDKMEDFIVVLNVAGQNELAAEAEAALLQLVN